MIETSQNGDTGDAQRTIGLPGALGVGVGAIVGGGILVLAGVAFSNAGPGAMAAFAANGVIALLTALTFAEMSTAFPESGGTYTYAKKVLSVRVAFAVGWVVWFAYIVAGVLYALGFAEYASLVLVQFWRAALGAPPEWLASRSVVVGLALTATGAYTLSLIRAATGGGQWATIGKVLIFGLLIIAGAWVLAGRPSGTVAEQMSPFLPGGGLGLAQAMGFTFIALQGFEIIATVAGEVKDPGRILPRAMLGSLGTALTIYLPLLFIISTAGTLPGQSIAALSKENPETIMATAVANYLGPAGYWMVVAAAILSTLSALQANILAASRVALSMARDRTLPGVLAQTHTSRGTPVMAIYASALALVVTLMMIPDLAAAGAAASLIFLVSFALAHWTGFLMRRRSGGDIRGFLTPLFPTVPLLGGAACAALAVFQAFSVPSAGGIAAVWLAFGVLLYIALFARRAQKMDAYAEAADPELVKYRGRSPLVLVPVANPASASSLVAVAGALAPPTVGRVLLLAVMRHDRADTDPESVGDAVASAQLVLHEALTAALTAGHAPEALMTLAPAPWDEIARVADAYHCESLLFGLHRIDDPEQVDGTSSAPLEELLNAVSCDVSIMTAREGWLLEDARRIFIPVGGKGAQDELRARLLGSLCRTGNRELTFARILPAGATDGERDEAQRTLDRLATEESLVPPRTLVLRSDDVVAAIAEQAAQSDLVILGLPRVRGRKLLGGLAIAIAREIPCPAILISHRT